MEYLFLLSITGLAVINDIWRGKIPNALVIAGLCIGGCWQFSYRGVSGILQFLGGSILPLLLLAVLYYFRMLGAGDIKLFSVIGGFLGVSAILQCIAIAFLAGAIISTILMIRRRILSKRLQYFLAYTRNYFQTKKWKPYRNEMEKESHVYFSIPIFISVILYVGGIY